MLPVAGLESKLGYQFQNRQLLLRALSHRSRSSDGDRDDNEQLEFLGDSILGFVVSDVLVSRNPEAREGHLSQLKSHLVSAAHLHSCALKIGLGDYLLLGKSEERNGGRSRKTLLADAVEAIIAAIYLDGGLHPASDFIATFVLQPLEDAAELANIEQLNHKSVLQERAQGLGLPTPEYQVVDTKGPEHARVFVVQGRIGERFSATGSGSSKKAASQAAAEMLISQLASNSKSSEELTTARS